MRHSSLELTGRYTRPRAVDIEAAVSMLPTLKPEADAHESAVMTGTDSTPISDPLLLRALPKRPLMDLTPNQAKSLRWKNGGLQNLHPEFESRRRSL